MHFPPKFGEENGGASYSPNVAYLAHWVGVGGGAGPQEAGAGPHFLLQKFFSYFPPLKPRCILWSGASYSPKNTVYVDSLIFSSCIPMDLLVRSTLETMVLLARAKVLLRLRVICSQIHRN